MAYLMSHGTSGDLAVRFDKRKKFVKELVDRIDEAEANGCYVVPSKTEKP